MQNEERGTRNEEEIVSAFCILHSEFSSYRLTGKLRFTAVYEAKVKCTRGPLVMYSMPNGLPHARFGISMSRHVGVAPKRVRIKRLLRESFRLHQWTCFPGYDLVIVVRPHAPMVLAEYRAAFSHLVSQGHGKWRARQLTS